MLSVTTSFIHRLKEHDRDAWFELWEVFGSSIERVVDSIARRYFSRETLQDIRQETLLRVFKEIRKFDTARGVKFSTWLHGIARHIVLEEIEHRNAQRRNRGVKPLSLDAAHGEDGEEPTPDAEFERQVFRAKVYHAIKLVEKESDFTEFEAYKLKVFSRPADARVPGPLKSLDVATVLGISEASVSRYLKKVRCRLQEVLRRVVREYSWADEELAEIGQHRLDADEDLFDAALGDIMARVDSDQRRYHRLGETAKMLL